MRKRKVQKHKKPAPKANSVHKKCIRCDKFYMGTKFQRWCKSCKSFLSQMYWEENF